MSDAADTARGALGMRGFERSLPMALLRARETVMRRFRPILKEHGLTEQQWRVLRALADAEEPQSVGALAEETYLLGPSLSRMLATLGGRGLVERRAGGDDARRAEIQITGAGRALVASIAPESEAQYARIEQSLGGPELDALYALLGRVAALDGAGPRRVSAGGRGSRRPPR